MRVKCEFEELDWKGNLVKRTEFIEHGFEVSEDLLLKASVEGSGEHLPIPGMMDFRKMANYSSNTAFLEHDLGINKRRLASLKRAVGVFKGWQLRIGVTNHEPAFEWEMT